MGLTVTQLSFDFGGSNPSLPTDNLRNLISEVFCFMSFRVSDYPMKDRSVKSFISLTPISENTLFSKNIYKTKDYKAIKHGYAISVHKAQGSEFEIVIMPITKEYRIMLYKKLVYTAITRAKRSLILVGDPTSFSKAVYNVGNKERRTLLKDILTSNIL